MIRLEAFPVLSPKPVFIICKTTSRLLNCSLERDPCHDFSH
jgi:hypothetical protein